MLKLHVDFASFFRRGVPNIKNNSLIALICGSMGSGKSYYAVKMLEDIKTPQNIRTNMKSYKSLKHNVTYFDSISELYNEHELDTIYVIDELSKKYVKDSKIDRAFYSWLQQSRKHNRQVYLITQEYIQVPQWLRGVASCVFTTHKYLFNICCTSFGYPVLDKDTMEWGLDESSLYFYKRTKKIARLYDTLETIDDL